MEFVFTCRKHGTELHGQPLIGQDANGMWVLEQSEMWCDEGNADASDVENYCFTEWKVTVTF